MINYFYDKIDYDKLVIKNSFDSCCITSQRDYHGPLKDLVTKYFVFNAYIDDIQEEDAILVFNNADEVDPNLHEVNSNLNDEVEDIEEALEIENETSPTLNLYQNQLNPLLE